MKNLKNIAVLIFIILLCLSAGAIGSIFTVSSIPTWYAEIIKPSFAPPNWVFGPVWTSLYILMGISAFLVWSKGFGKKDVRFALLIFGVQLILNALWSFIFFGLQNPGLAFAEIILLWLAILFSIKEFYKINKVSALLLLPYFLWVSFASYLNYAIWILNK